MGEAEQADQSIEHRVDDDVEVVRSTQPGRELGQRSHLVPVPGRRPRVGVEQAEVVRAFDRQDAEDRSRPQAEDRFHVCVGRDRIDVVPQAFEHRAPTLGPFVSKSKAVVGGGGRVEQQQAGGRVGREVA